MIQVLYFASLREQVGTAGEQLALEESRTVAELRARLCVRGNPWAEALGRDQTILSAVNQQMAGPDTALADGDEVAFFPPVTGG
jgi:molybdopterin synthase sulfur carrier subunit